MSKENKHLIIIDDDADLLEIMSHMIGLFEVNVTCFKKPEIALDWLKTDENTCDFVLCDVNMPSINGLKFVSMLSSADVFPKDKIKLISVDISLNDEEPYCDSGFEIIAKPISPVQSKMMLEAIGLM